MSIFDILPIELREIIFNELSDSIIINFISALNLKDEYYYGQLYNKAIKNID